MLKRLFVLGGLLVLGGCQTLGISSVHDVGERLNGPRLIVPPEWQTAFNDAPDTNKSQLAREFAMAMIADSDRHCEDYLVGLSAGNNTFGATMDLAALGANLLGAGTSSLANANNLATGAGVFQSLRSTATRNVFAGQEFALIYDTVHAGRDAERKALMTAIEADRFASWGPHSILAVVNAYDVKCGVNYAAMLIRQNLAKNAPQATGIVPAQTEVVVGAGQAGAVAQAPASGSTNSRPPDS